MAKEMYSMVFWCVVALHVSEYMHKFIVKFSEHLMQRPAAGAAVTPCLEAVEEKVGCVCAGSSASSRRKSSVRESTPESLAKSKPLKARVEYRNALILQNLQQHKR